MLPTVYGYVDYRRYLVDVFGELKKRDHKFSFRSFARLANSTSPNFLQLILANKMGLSPAQTVALARAFGLNKREQMHFESLVAFDRARGLEEKDKILKRIVRSGRREPDRIVSKEQYEYFSKWHHSAVRALIGTCGPKKTNEGCRELARRLTPSVSTREVRESVELLLKLGLVRENEEGNLAQSEAVISTGDDVRSFQVANYQMETMKLAMTALEKCPADLREIATLTLNISDRGFAEIRERIRAFRKELMEVAARDRNDDRVYQLNLQFFPMTRSDEYNPSPCRPLEELA